MEKILGRLCSLTSYLMGGMECLCSLWHVGIYSSAFFILCSTTKSSAMPEVNAEGYERANLQQISTEGSPRGSPVLRHTVELDAFASGRSRDDLVSKRM